MPESMVCLNVRKDLEEIRLLQQDFFQLHTALSASEHVNNKEAVLQIKSDLKRRIQIIKELLIPAELERIFRLREQYDFQAQLLEDTGLVEAGVVKDVSGKEQKILYTKGIDGEKYPLPSFKEILKQMQAKNELLHLKADQQFTKLLLVPFGMNLYEMIQKLEWYLQYKKRKGGAFTMDEETPVYLFDRGDYEDTDVNGDMLYDPLRLAANKTQGLTKSQILKDQTDQQAWNKGWRIILVQGSEDGDLILPAPGKEDLHRTNNKFGREPIVTGRTPLGFHAEMLKRQTDTSSPYQGEFGMTVEEWIVAFMVQLEKTGVPLDSTITDRSVYLNGACFARRGCIPYVEWGLNLRAKKPSVYMSRSYHQDFEADRGIRFAVRI